MVVTYGMYLLHQLLMLNLIDQKKLTIFQCLNVQCRRLVCEETVKICNPPTLKTELNNFLGTFIINRVSNHCPFLNKSKFSANIPLLEQILSSPESLRNKFRFAKLPLFRGQGNMSVNTLIYCSNIALGIYSKSGFRAFRISY